MPHQLNEFKTKLRQLRNHYITQLPARYDSIMAALRHIHAGEYVKENLEALRFIAHSLAGSAGSFGLYALSNKARKLDTFLKKLLENTPDSIPDEQLNQLAYLINDLLAVPTDNLDDDILDLALDIDADDKAVLIERALVIDDDITADIIRRSIGCRVQQLQPRAERNQAIETIREFRPDTFIVDSKVLLEDTGVGTIVRDLQQSGLEILVICLADNEEAASHVASLAGTVHCITKPLDADQLRQLAAGHDGPWIMSKDKQADTTAQAKHSRASHMHQLTILYIEDNPVNSKLISMVLAAKCGYNLVIRDTGEAALEYLETTIPDLILLDINLPGMDGYSAYRQIRARPALNNVPVIALSGNTMNSDQQHAEQAGFDAYLTKPVNIDKLLDTINAFILVE